MSRHRNVKKIDIDDELDDNYDDDDDYYGRSFEEPMSPGTAQYLRHPLSSASTNRPNLQLGAFITEEEPVVDDEHNYQQGEEDLFKMDDIGPPPGFPAKLVQPQISEPLPTLPPPSQSAKTFAIHQLPPLPVSSSSSTHVGETNDKPVLPNISTIRLSETSSRSTSRSPSRSKTPSRLEASSTAPTLIGGGTLPANQSSHRLNQLAAISSAQSTPKRSRKTAADGQGSKALLNVVVVGHVDAGKSTLMGHLLCNLGYVDQRMIHRYRNESNQAGKASFAYAWVLDDTEQERTRGVTMDIARTTFETDTKKVVLLDAPGHKDFIPNMITGASQADAAILVVNATQGEFETGLENGGQTKEHAMLLRSFGISQILVAVNKLDTVDWSKQRYDAIVVQIKTFLTKHAGFQSSKCTFVPVSGLDGDNLTELVKPDHPLAKWYKGPTLIKAIDSFQPPERMTEGPLRIVITDVFKIQPNSISLAGKVESGDVMAGDKLFIMPTAVGATVKYCTSDTEGQCDQMCCGEQGQFTLTGTFEPDTIAIGHVIVAGGPDTLKPTKRLLVRLVVFDIQVPIMKGTRAELYCHSMCEPCTFIHLQSSINKSDGTMLKKKPRCLSKNMSGMVEIETDHEVAIEPYTVCRALGRITIRRAGNTIAVGIVEQTFT